MTKLKPFKHQKATLALRQRSEIILDLSEPGTGKTLAHLWDFAARRAKGGGAGLVVAPLTLIDTVWPHEARLIDKDLSVSVAFASNRAKALVPGHDLYVTNYEGMKVLADNPALQRQLGIDWFCLDEGTAIKNPMAQRSKAAFKVAKSIEYKALLSGSLGAAESPVTDYWAPTFMLDQGERLGKQFSGFRAAVCTPVQVGPQANMVQWVPKEGALEAVAGLLSDISIRHLFETSVTQSIRSIEFDLPRKLRQHYEAMAKQQALLLKDRVITAVNGGAAAQKLMQIASGSLYDNDGAGALLDTKRYELVADLACERPRTLIAFRWQHQREALLDLLTKRGRRVAFIDGTVSGPKRKQIVEDHKRGLIDDLLLQPAAAAHGLTLLGARTTIWASPTYSYEEFDQLNRRNYRTGQDQDCEVIVVAARATLDERAFEICLNKGKGMNAMFDAIADFT